MHAGVGYSDNPDTASAGASAAMNALRDAGRDDPCDIVLLFSTSRHDASTLRDAVASVVGPSVGIFGGGAVGAITNDRFGYAGDQIAMACLWLDDVRADILVEGGLLYGEMEVGRRLGQRLAGSGATPESPVILFYDAIDRTGGNMRLIMATYILAGIEETLGWLPNLNGAGLQGDYAATPTMQWVGDGIAQHQAIALLFSGDVRVDSVIMHGCRPATRYYTVTKTDEQVILEINERPALEFVDELLGGAISPEDYPFFLIFGVNKGDKWGNFDENSYANRLCLGIDRERGGIVMFEPDMVAGTDFQIMYRSLDLGYMQPRIDGIFADIGNRKPVLAVYINCAGRAAGYGGVDMEDAVMVQKTVAGRAPVLGIYTGVEIASVEGRPRGLDWTGVFCLFSVPERERKND
ncbi:MAG: FIST C-terminal domain-containing protein [Synergistaceae bacterium]|jgi:small ligand-binding sensory domain FIST|nr:FIST C-terminal domain-containing protein [Synergistaceae bacterium]